MPLPEVGVRSRAEVFYSQPECARGTARGIIHSSRVFENIYYLSTALHLKLAILGGCIENRAGMYHSIVKLQVFPKNPQQVQCHRKGEKGAKQNTRYLSYKKICSAMRSQLSVTLGRRQKPRSHESEE